MTQKLARENGKGFARAAGCEEENADCLRGLSTNKILELQTPYLLNEFIIDGKILPVHPADAYKSGDINHATLVHGNTRDEGRFFVALPEHATGTALSDTAYLLWLEKQYGPELAQDVIEEYPLQQYENASEAFSAAITDSMFACTGLAMSRVLSDKMPVYAYEFADRTAPSYVGHTTFALLAAHTFELGYVFPGFKGGGGSQVVLNPLQENLSNEMVRYFSDLAGMASREAHWPRFDPKKDDVMSFELPDARMVSGRFAQSHRCSFWDRKGIY